MGGGSDLGLARIRAPSNYFRQANYGSATFATSMLNLLVSAVCCRISLFVRFGLTAATKYQQETRCALGAVKSCRDIYGLATSEMGNI